MCGTFAAALRNAAARRTPDDMRVHRLQTLLQDLATLTKNRVRFAVQESDVGASTGMPAQPTPLQQGAFALLELSRTLWVAAPPPLIAVTHYLSVGYAKPNVGTSG